MAIKLKKTLYVGIGGTGVTTLLKVKKCFIDSYGEIPPMIGFLAIDTDKATNSDSVTSNRGEAIGLAPSELLVCTVKRALQVYRTNPDIYDWVPSANVNALAGIQGGGAGQVRSNGRFIAYYNKKNIENRVNAAVSKVTALIPEDSKYAIDMDSDSVEYPIVINVVGSIAGGTGSGMLIDLLCIIRESLDLTKTVELHPWIVLPDIFEEINKGPSMANILYNSYGALRELDYLMHYDPKSSVINFGHTKINEPIFDYAYIINNVNSVGVSFNSLNDITDVMAKSMFLPANEMGNNVSSPFDNISTQKMAGTYNIANKKAWAATVSSSELVYDGQTVGRVYAYRIIEQLCASMLLPAGNNSVAVANNFVDDPNVLIRETQGKDYVIDALLSPGPVYMLNVTGRTTLPEINDYIGENCNVANLATMNGGLNDKLNNKLGNATKALDNYIAKMMGYEQGQVDEAVKFMVALKDIIGMCKNEMTKEKKYYDDLNEISVQWEPYLDAVTHYGIFKTKQKEAIEELQYKLSEVVTNRREGTRRDWALAFYIKFENVVDDRLQKLKKLSSSIEKIADNCRKIQTKAAQDALSSSNFQISLHEKEVRTALSFKINDDIRNNFVSFLGNGIFSWIEQSQDFIEETLWNFAQGTAKVKEVVNVDINSLLLGMSEAKVKEYLDRLKLLASPLWTYNTQGFAKSAQQLDRFVVVGVGNRDTSILSTDVRYNTYLDMNDHKASFASTGRNDRVYVLIVEDLLPIYAVNNFKKYEYDHELKVMNGGGMANYLDEKLNKRMNDENFGLVPKTEKDNVLEYWVLGFIFDLIHYDSEGGTYWIRSKSKGDAIRKFRFNLNKSRDVAYDMFRTEQLYKEVEEVINVKIAKEGKNSIDKEVKDIKEKDSYFEKVSQLSPLEMENIDNPKFRSVKDLVEQEIKLMTS